MGAGSIAQQVFATDMPDTTTPSRTPFSSSFHQPDPPLIKSEFRANWHQHKWDANVSHVASGFLYSSPSQKKVRVDMAYDTTIGSSLFDYSDVTQEGVANKMWTLTPAIASAPQYFFGYVEPAFPLVSEDLLVASQAVYAGVVKDPYAGEVTAWDIMYGSVLPTTVLLDKDDIIQGFDFWKTDSRTRVITRFFNVVVGKINEDVFAFPQQASSKL